MSECPSCKCVAVSVSQLPECSSCQCFSCQYPSYHMISVPVVCLNCQCLSCQYPSYLSFPVVCLNYQCLSCQCLSVPFVKVPDVVVCVSGGVSKLPMCQKFRSQLSRHHLYQYIKSQLTRTAAQWQRDHKIAVTLRMVSISQQLLRTAKCSWLYQRLSSINAGIIHKKRYPAVCVNSIKTKTQRCSWENATLQLRERDVAVACAQMQLEGHNNASSSNSILNWSKSLPLSWLPSQLKAAVYLGVQPTSACSWFRQHETPIRASDKLQNKRSHAVRVSSAYHDR